MGTGVGTKPGQESRHEDAAALPDGQITRVVGSGKIQETTFYTVYTYILVVWKVEKKRLFSCSNAPK